MSGLNGQPVRVADLTWPEFVSRIDALPLALLPVGALEQHGLHLPLDTDTVIAERLAELVAAQLGALVLPPLAYGARSLARSGGGSQFPGTVNLRGATLMDLTEDVVSEQARHGVRQVVILLGHGENDPFAIEGAEIVLRRLQQPGFQLLVIGWWHVLAVADVEPLFPEGFPGWDREHAARVETALMLALSPQRVRQDQIQTVDPIIAAPYTLLPTPDGAVPSQGSLADPRGATAEEGWRLVNLITARLAQTIQESFALVS